MSDIIDTRTIPHWRFTIPLPWNPKSKYRVTYYIGGIGCEGIREYSEFQIHKKIDGNDDGYAGSTLDFLMNDGTIEKVKGPFYEYRPQHNRILFEILTAVTKSTT